MITVYRWDCSAQACSRVESHQLPPSAAEISPEDVYWVDLIDPTPEEERSVFEQFLHVHTLTLEPITKPRRQPDQGAHFPKVEEFPDYLFVIVNPLSPDLAAAVAKKPKADEPPPPKLPLVRATRLLHRHRPQLSAVMTRNVLITHHYQPLACVDETREFVERHGTAARRGPDYLLHLGLDERVDESARVVAGVAPQLEGLEPRLFKDPSPKVLSRILGLKRLVVGLRKTLILEREVLARLVRGEFD